MDLALSLSSQLVASEVDDLEGQHYDEFTLGYERMIGRGFKAGVRGIYRTLDGGEDPLLGFFDRRQVGIESLLFIGAESSPKRVNRAFVPVVVSGECVLWVVGHRRSDAAPVTERTEQRLVLRVLP